MLTRRVLLAACALSCVDIARGTQAPAGAGEPAEPVNFDVPPGACDAHTHVVGDPAEFPMSAKREYTPPVASVDELARVAERLKLDRVVIVTPTIYGTDNAATAAALTRLGQARARGVALIDETTSPRMLDSLQRARISGIRLFLDLIGERDRDAAAAKRLQWATEIAEPRGWHLEIATPPDVIAALSPQVSSCPVPVVLDCFGWVAGGVRQAGFDAILSLVKSSRSYVKLAEPYRLSKQAPDYPDLFPVIRELVSANPEQLVWGSGWPHVDSGRLSGRARMEVTPNLPVDAGHLLNLFARCVPDVATRRKILVDNPARLYGF